MASTEGSALPNAVKEKRPRKSTKAPLSHPTYLQMIVEAITSLKERSGSSNYAIGNYIDGKYKAHLPANYKKLLTGQLRKLAKSGKLTKVKGSFKVPAELKKVSKPKPTKSVKAAPAKKPTSAKPKPKPKPKPKSKPVSKPKAVAVKAPKAPKKAPVVATKKAEKPPAKKAKVPAPKKTAKKPVEKKAASPKTVKKTPKKAVKKTPKKAKK